VNRDAVIQVFLREGGDLGRSARGGVYFAHAGKLNFRRCRCSYADPTYNRVEYIARGPHGALIVIARSRKNHVITIGNQGYHCHRPKVPACVPPIRSRKRPR
jgi:hypothetical protein